MPCFSGCGDGAYLAQAGIELPRDQVKAHIERQFMATGATGIVRG